MKITGKTNVFAVLGHPVSHSFSPQMHNAAFQALGRDGVYLAYDVEPDNLMQVLESMRLMGFGGTNLTVPLKEVAFAGIKDLDASAQLARAVNTVVFGPDGLKGYTTDGYGLTRALEDDFGTSVQGRAVMILGAGGAGRAAALTCAESGAKAVRVGNRTRKRGDTVCAEVREHFPEVDADCVSAYDDQVEAARKSDIIIQATSVGMKAGDSAVLEREAFQEGQIFMDMIYVFPETCTMKAAAAGGARTGNGLSMLLHQGIRSFEIWTGEEPPAGPMREALEEAVYSA